MKGVAGQWEKQLGWPFPGWVNVWPGRRPSSWGPRGKAPLTPRSPWAPGLSVFFSQPPHQPFLEMEQLRLARQLEGLWARLALHAKEDVMPKLSSETQSEGRDPGSRRVA